MIRLQNLTLQRGPQRLLESAELTLHPGQKAGLIGANGAGKSSLFALLRGQLGADAGDCHIPAAWRIAHMRQEVDTLERLAVDYVLDGDIDLRRIQRELAAAEAAQDGNALGRLHADFEAADGYTADARARKLLAGLGFTAAQMERQVGDFSGGWRMRLNLAQALMCPSDLLLLDEPTNHLDIGAIAWLEDALRGYPGAVLFITHDRAFLQALATRILELDRGNLIDWQGDYASFLVHKEQQLAAEETANALFDKRLAQEEVWIRQGIKARRTRNEGRVRALKAMRNERSERRERQGKANLLLETADKSGKQVILAEHMSYAHPGGEPLIRDLTLLIQRGDRIGLLGPNGSGKTTLLKLLLGDLQPTAGKIQYGTKLEIAYFDQLRLQLEPEKTVIDNLAEGREFITINGQDRHVLSYLGDFLFSPQRARTPVKALSGGERARLLLAKLFSKPANLLVLDEPTNDLDVETLELLEEVLLSFEGTVLMVSHDRAFLDNVVTSTLVFEGEGRVREYVGGYQDWLRQGGSPRLLGVQTREDSKPAPAKAEPVPAAAPVAAAVAPAKRKLSYKEQRELDALPGAIETAEIELEALQTAIADPGFYQLPNEVTQAKLARMDALQAELDRLIERWAELE